MILNAYAILDVFLTLLRLTFGLLVIGIAVITWKKRSIYGPESRHEVENRSYLLVLFCFLLLALNIASWPLFYLLLQSYVSHWPGVMCIYGVTRIGTGTVGPSRFLPELLATLQCTKPVLVFLTGSWFLLYLINRRTPTAPLLGRILVLVMVLGIWDVIDAGVEMGYLIIPKKEEFLSAGCCTNISGYAGAGRFLPPGLMNEENHPFLYAAYYGINLGMALLLGFSTVGSGPVTIKSILPLLGGALASLAVNGVFLTEIAAPRLLHMPNHHCVYDLLPKVPESLVGISLFLGGLFLVGWAFVGCCLGRCGESESFLGPWLRRLLFLALFCYLGSLALMSMELALA